MYALIEIAGKQFKVVENQQFKIPYCANKVGDKIHFDKILYFDDGKKKNIGTPYIPNCSIDATIISHGKQNKVIVFKMKRRKGYQKKQGHRQNYTVVEVGAFSTKKTTAAKKTTTKKTTAAKKTTTKKTAATKKDN